jgi:hypothetical protein
MHLTSVFATTVFDRSTDSRVPTAVGKAIRGKKLYFKGFCTVCSGLSISINIFSFSYRQTSSLPAIAL